MELMRLSCGSRPTGEIYAEHSLRILQESQIKGRKHQDNSDVNYQPFPESILKEQYIYANNNGNQHPNVKHDRHVSCHFNLPFSANAFYMLLAVCAILISTVFTQYQRCKIQYI